MPRISPAAPSNSRRMPLVWPATVRNPLTAVSSACITFSSPFCRLVVFASTSCIRLGRGAGRRRGRACVGSASASASAAARRRARRRASSSSRSRSRTRRRMAARSSGVRSAKRGAIERSGPVLRRGPLAASSRWRAAITVPAVTAAAASAVPPQTSHFAAGEGRGQARLPSGETSPCGGMRRDSCGPAGWRWPSGTGRGPKRVWLVASASVWLIGGRSCWDGWSWTILANPWAKCRVTHSTRRAGECSAHP